MWFAFCSIARSGGSVSCELEVTGNEFWSLNHVALRQASIGLASFFAVARGEAGDEAWAICHRSLLLVVHYGCLRCARSETKSSFY